MSKTSGDHMLLCGDQFHMVSILLCVLRIHNPHPLKFFSAQILKALKGDGEETISVETCRKNACEMITDWLQHAFQAVSLQYFLIFNQLSPHKYRAIATLRTFERKNGGAKGNPTGPASLADRNPCDAGRAPDGGRWTVGPDGPDRARGRVGSPVGTGEGMSPSAELPGGHGRSMNQPVFFHRSWHLRSDPNLHPDPRSHQVGAWARNSAEVSQAFHVIPKGFWNNPKSHHPPIQIIVRKP